MRCFYTILAFVYTFIINVEAQQTFSGTVTDGEGVALEMAAVQMIRTSSGGLVGYSLTDAGGKFSIRTAVPSDSLTMVVSLLGYAAHREEKPQRSSIIRMKEEVFALREVEIRPGRVWSRSDTVNYDVARFLTAKDETIKDIIKKLPGVNISETGRITYNGRDITNFYVEGMDPAGGQYGRIVNNLDARSVETVQLLENHQPIRMLKDMIKTENVALNLKLRAEFRDKWMVMLQAGAGISSGALWDASGNAFRLGRSSQSVYAYKTNNTGRDITDEQTIFFSNSREVLPEPSFRPRLVHPSVTAPLSLERLLFNNMHTVSVNRLNKRSETARLRINAGFTHDERRQERGSTTSYYTQSGTQEIKEESSLWLNSNHADVNLDYEDNSSEKYIVDKLRLSASSEESRARYQGHHPVDQRISTLPLSFSNELSAIWKKKENDTREIRSMLRYSSMPSTLKLDTMPSPERLPFNTMYAAHSYSILRKKDALVHRYTAGINAQVSNIASAVVPYVLPSFQWSRSSWYATLAIPVSATTYIGRDISRVSASPSLGIQYRPHYAWRLNVSASYREAFGDITDLYSQPYRRDYRTMVDNGGILHLDRIRACSLNIEYRRTVYEFFASLSLARRLTASNYIIEEIFDAATQDRTILTHSSPRNSEAWTIQGVISKGLYDYGIKLSLDGMFTDSRSLQISSGAPLPYRSSYVQLEPKITWSPFRRLETAWQATFRYGGSRIGRSELAPLAGLVQKLRLSYEYSGIEYNITGDHYYNDISSTQSIHTMLADLSIRWKPGKWQLEIALSNIFDQRRYSYTQYTAAQSYTSWVDIRGRELLFTARYRF